MERENCVHMAYQVFRLHFLSFSSWCLTGVITLITLSLSVGSSKSLPLKSAEEVTIQDNSVVYVAVVVKVEIILENLLDI